MCANITCGQITRAFTVTALGLATVGLGVAAAVTTAGTVATVAYSVLAVLAAGTSIASMTAWAVSDDSRGAAGYFATMGEHMLFAIPAAIQFVGQIFVQALVKGAADGIGRAVARKFGGDDLTVRVHGQ